jgi:hypothetical protein
VEYFNQAVTSAFSLLLAPFSQLAPLWGLLFVSILAGIALAYAYGRLSNQAALRRVKRSITAGMFESVLFRSDLRTSLVAQGRMLWGGVRYFCLAIPPILLLLIPSVCILAQLNLRYGARTLEPGESALLSVNVSDTDALFEAELKAPPGVTLTPPLRDLEHNEVVWRVQTPKSGQITEPLTLSIAGVSSHQPLFTSPTPPRTIPTHLYTSPLWQFLYPGGTVPEALRKHVTSISITYPEQQIVVAGLHANWLVLFVCISIVAGFVASKVLGIEI